MNLEHDRETLKDVVRYDPETGAFYWAKKIGRTVKVGAVAGCDSGYGYIQMFGRHYLKHRLAFVIMTGAAPKMVDHKNGNKYDNRWSNLRAADDKSNQWNQKRSAHNSTGAKNVSYSEAENRRKRYKVSFRVGGKVKHFGRYETLSEAIEVATCLRKQLHGEFARHA